MSMLYFAATLFIFTLIVSSGWIGEDGTLVFMIIALSHVNLVEVSLGLKLAQKS